MVFLRTLPALLFAVVLLVSCTGNSLTGTTDETVVTAHVYNPDHSPAVNATVKVFAVGDTSRIPVYQTVTDNTGKYIDSVGSGIYNVLAEKDSLAAFQDSVIIQSSYSTLTDDTLAKPVTLAGLVLMQPMHDPRTATVQILGTDKYSNVLSNGSFSITGLPPGSYALRSVTTVAEYTPTFTWLDVKPSAKDTVRDTIELIYTGIPAIRSIQATYDTLHGIVHLSWDTTDYFLLRDYLIYRDVAPVLTPSTQPIGSSTVCKYDDTITGINGNLTEFVYRVAVRTKNLVIGQTFTDAQVTVYTPLTVYTYRDSFPVYLGMPDTLRIYVSGYTGSHVTYAWDIGNKGVFVPSLSPETTIVLHDTITQDYESVVKVLVDNTIFAIDTIRQATQFGWQKVAEAFADTGSYYGITAVVLGSKIIAFGEKTRPALGSPNRISEWQSADGQNWSKVTDSIPVPCAALQSKPVAFLNRICMVDDSGYLWTSAQPGSWNRVSGTPVCKTVELYTGPSTPPQGTLCSPALFVDGSKILLQPFLFTGSQTILSSSDLINWDSTSGYQMQSFVFDYAQLNGAVTTVGFDFASFSLWFGVKSSAGVSYFDPPSYQILSSSGAWDYTLATYKSSIVYWSPWASSMSALTDITSHQWYVYAQVPSAKASSLVVFNGSLYFVSTAGIYKANN